MIKLSDYVFDYLEKIGVRDVFMISGGGAMHLVDSLGRNKKMHYVCPHHEQAAAIAAEGYARFSGRLGVVVVTSGPGGTNTLTGVIGQWLDSVPVLYISGQVKFETTIASCPRLGLRQLGDQEINIVDIVRPVTKYAAMVTDPKTIGYHLEKAVYLAKSGRPGPVWLDIPLNVQAAMVDEKKLKKFVAAGDALAAKKQNKKQLAGLVQQVWAMLQKAKRPILVAGHGIRLAGAQAELAALIEKLQIPVLTTFNGCDLVPTAHPLYIGHPGTIGDRAGNFALQNADLVVFIGTRNNIRQISYNWGAYVRHAQTVAVDIDPPELKKASFRPTLPVCADAKVFLQILLAAIGKTRGARIMTSKEWLRWCQEKKKKYPVVLPEYARQSRAGQTIHPYYFVAELSQQLPAGATVVAGNGTASVVWFQAGEVKVGQRVIWNSGCASMGYDLPAAVGACIGKGKKPVVCIAGDGSLQMNIQELQTMFHYNLPIKLFVLNNRGYVSIRQTQDGFFGGNYVGSGPDSGVSFPDIIKVARAYGIRAQKISSADGLKQKLAGILGSKGPVVCEVALPPDYVFSPKLASFRLPDGKLESKPLEDMSPFLGREEFIQNMLVPLWESR